MALTLAEAAKLSNDVLLAGIIETIIKDSPVLQRPPFIEVVGNGLTYNREATAPSAAFFDVGDTWTESTPTFTQQTVSLKIMGGDADIDNFLIATRSNLQDLEAAVVELKAKAVRQLFEQTFVTGDATANPKSFDGLDKVVDPAQSLSMGANGGPPPPGPPPPAASSTSSPAPPAPSWKPTATSSARCSSSTTASPSASPTTSPTPRPSAPAPPAPPPHPSSRAKAPSSASPPPPASRWSASGPR